jgi:antitoxin component of RelBE/YafQ-DinJ toxin-antitoxin module
MRGTVQARLDRDTAATLAKLVAQHGWTPSRAVREGLRLLAKSQMLPQRLRIAGLGKFSSGIRDLGSNPKHLQGFGS